MKRKDALYVTIKGNEKMKRNSSESQGSEEQSQSNQFANSGQSQSERQNVALRTIEQPVVRNSPPKVPPRLPEVRPQVTNESRVQPSSTNRDNISKIAEQSVDMRGRNQVKRNSKQNSFDFMSPQLESKQLQSSLNRSEVVKNEGKGRNSSILNSEEERIGQINKNREQLSSSINDIKGTYDELKLAQKVKKVKKPKKLRQHQSPFGVKLSPEKQRQIKQFLSLKKKEKQERHQILQDIALKESHKRRLQEREEEMIKQRQRKRRLKQLKDYSKFNEKHQEWKQTLQQKQKIAEQVVRKYQGKVGYHLRAEKKAQKIRQKMKDEEFNVIRERKQVMRPHDESQFVEHQRWHDDKIDQLMFEKGQAREEELARIDEQNCRNNQLWHGQSHSNVAHELNQMKKKKRQPKQKARRMNEYKQYIKNNFLPRTYQHKSLDPPQISQRNNKSHRQVRRYRYYKGVARGQIKQELPAPKSDKEVRRMGDNYLEFVKALPKKIEEPRNDDIELQPEDLQILQKKFNSNVARMKRSIPSIYDDGRKKKTAIEVTKNVKRDQLQMMVLQLQSNDKRLKNKQTFLNHNQFGNVEKVQGEQKEINQGFVENIQRKLALLAQL